MTEPESAADLARAILEQHAESGSASYAGITLVRLARLVLAEAAANELTALWDDEHYLPRMSERP